MLPLRARVDLGAMAVKGCSVFLEVPPFSIISRTLVGAGVLPLGGDAVGVFYGPS